MAARRVIAHNQTCPIEAVGAASACKGCANAGLMQFLF